jgi:RNA polymerase sigma-70 factor, ECF subfamily
MWGISLRETLEKTTTATGRPPLTETERLRLVTGTDFDAIVRENSRRLFNIAYHMLGNAEDSEEMVQEIFLEAYVALPGYKGDAPVANWLYRIAMNVLADHISAKKRKPRIADEISLEDRVQTGPQATVAGSAESEYLKSAELERIRGAVLELPARYRAVFVLNVVEGYSHKEIAKILGISPGAVRVIRVRAAKMLRKIMSKYGLNGRGNDDALQI